MQRKLASIQKVAALSPIENADFIEKATVMGWSIIVKKGDFKVGDLCVFFEIDSVLPEAEWSEFMRDSKFRVRTKKMRGVLSQGLAMPAALFGIHDLNDWQAGDDVTALTGVTKYERSTKDPKDQNKDYLGDFPSFVPRTDEIRLQSAIEVLEELKGLEVVATVKLDGTSATYAMLDGELWVCSRNQRVRPEVNVYARMAEKYSLQNLPDGYAIQGEICAPGIQKNLLGLKEADLFIFTVFDIRQGQYLGWEESLVFCYKMKLNPVPLSNWWVSFDESLESLLGKAEGFYRETKNHREGIVVRPTIPQHSQVLGGNLSVKVINNQYLLKAGE